eukprot:Amastigsp_a676473_6.p2 type:complete len:235 gc:universal Amastigsp_a676473_6:1008-304(-)
MCHVAVRDHGLFESEKVTNSSQVLEPQTEDTLVTFAAERAYKARAFVVTLCPIESSTHITQLRVRVANRSMHRAGGRRSDVERKKPICGGPESEQNRLGVKNPQPIVLRDRPQPPAALHECAKTRMGEEPENRKEELVRQRDEVGRPGAAVAHPRKPPHRLFGVEARNATDLCGFERVEELCGVQGTRERVVGLVRLDGFKSRHEHVLCADKSGESRRQMWETRFVTTLLRSHC